MKSFFFMAHGRFSGWDEVICYLAILHVRLAMPMTEAESNEPDGAGAEPGANGVAGVNGDGAPDDGSTAEAEGGWGANGDRDV